MDNALTQLQKTKNRDQKFTLRGELRTLRKELQEIEQKTVGGLIKECQVILATNTGAADRIIKVKKKKNIIRLHFGFFSQTT